MPRRAARVSRRIRAAASGPGSAPPPWRASCWSMAVVEEHGQEHRGRAVDGHGHGGGRVGQVEAGEQLLHVVQGGHAHPAFADLAMDVRAPLGVLAVQGDRIQGRGQAPAGLPAQELEPAVGALWAAFAGELALGPPSVRRWVQAPAVKGKRPGTFSAQVADDGAQAVGVRQGHPGQAGPGGAAGVPVGTLRGLAQGRPLGQQGLAIGIQRGPGLGRLAAQGRALGVPAVRPRRFPGPGAGRPPFPGPRCGSGSRARRRRSRGGSGSAAREQRGAALVLEGRRARIGPGRAPGRSGRRHEAQQVQVEAVHARIVEAAGHGAVHRQPEIGQRFRQRVVAPELPPYRLQRVLGPGVLELVDHHHLGQVQHVDLLQLGAGAELAGHDVHRQLGQIGEIAVALADAAGLHRPARRPGAAAQQPAAPRIRCPRPPARLRKNTRGSLALFMRSRSPSSAPPELRRMGSMARIPTRRAGKSSSSRRATSSHRELLPAPPGPVKPTTGASAPAGLRGLRAVPARAALSRRASAIRAGPAQSAAPGGSPPASCLSGPHCSSASSSARDPRQQVLDHAVQAQPLAVPGGVQLFHPGGLQGGHLLRQDHAAAAAEYPDLGGPGGLEPLDQVGKKAMCPPW